MGRGAKGGCIPVLVHPIWADWRGDRLLEQVQPRFVVVYDPDPTIVRQLEVRRMQCHWVYVVFAHCVANYMW